MAESANGHLRRPRVAIVGAGMSGIGMACHLQDAGFDDFQIYEMADDLGGTWHANRYPGLSCDVASRYYAYTFAPNPDWSHAFSPGSEIWAYLDRVARERDLRERIAFNAEVEVAEWVDDEWRLRTKDGREGRYDFIVGACGALVRPRKPEIEGIDDFEGRIFHSAEWEHDAELEGKRVAVIGTGSTGMQITRAVGPIASRYEWYQRTPQWIFPAGNHRYSRLTRWAMRRFPRLNDLAYRTWQRLYEATFSTAVIRPGIARTLLDAGCRMHLWRIRDPELRRKMRPSDKPMCKRLVMGTGIYPVLERENVDVVDVPIERIEAGGIRTRDGDLHEQDVIVLATGFDAHAFVRPMELIGPLGNRLSEAWSEEPYSYKTVGMPGFPNFLMLIGPFSPFGNQSLFAISETQAQFAIKCIELWRERGIAAMAPRAEATETFNAQMLEAIPNTTWATGCSSWYIGKNGLPVAWPFSPKRHRDELAEPRLEEWELNPSGEVIAGSRSDTLQR